MVRTNPLVSVIMPVRNGQQTIERSVQSVLGQTMADFELLVVDDGSTDGTARMVGAVADHRCALLAQSHAGVSAARNAGLAKASGRLVAFLDADDEVDERWLAHLVAPFDDPNVGLVCCGGVQRDAAGGSESLSPHPSGELLRGYVVLFLAGAFMVRADVLAAAGGYAPLRYGENFELGFRITRVLAQRGLRAIGLADELVRWFPDAARSATRDASRLEAAEYTLSHYGQELTRHGRALVHRVASVNARRTGGRAVAVAHGVRAVAARPDRLENWRTMIGAVIGRAARSPVQPTGALPSTPAGMPVSGPAVSVVMPAFNAASTLQRAIDSVLAQTYSNFELVVVDDGSTDETPTILARQVDERIRVIRMRDNVGIVGALNRGLEEARGALIARLDADDEALPERLALQVEAFATHPNLVLCGCAADRVDPQGTRLGRSVPPASHARLAAAMVTGNRLVHSTVMFRRDAARACGGYRPDQLLAEDYGLWLRLMRAGEALGLTAVGARHTDNPAGLSRQHEARQRAVTLSIAPAGRVPDPGARRVRLISRQTTGLRADLRRRGIPVQGSALQWQRIAFAESRGGRLRRWLTVFLASPRLFLLALIESRPGQAAIWGSP
jgi:glycosyltransferase involved in cell wall biosynthesis